MKKSKIDLSDIKEKDLDNTATFTDLIPKKEKKNDSNDDIEDMINEKKRNTKDLTKDVEIAKEKVKEEIEDTKIFDIKEKKPIKEKKVKNKKEKSNKKEPSCITDIGVFLLVVISYFIYCLLYTNFYDNKKVLLINIVAIIIIFLLYAFSIIFNRKISKFIILAILIILIGFIAFNLLNSLGFNII